MTKKKVAKRAANKQGGREEKGKVTHVYRQLVVMEFVQDLEPLELGIVEAFFGIFDIPLFQEC